MAEDEAIQKLYEWEAGCCFRCARAGVDSTLLVRLPMQSGEEVEVRACRGCLLVLEGMRRRADECAGRDYRPGSLGRREVECGEPPPRGA